MAMSFTSGIFLFYLRFWELAAVAALLLNISGLLEWRVKLDYCKQVERWKNRMFLCLCLWLRFSARGTELRQTERNSGICASLASA